MAKKATEKTQNHTKQTNNGFLGRILKMDKRILYLMIFSVLLAFIIGFMMAGLMIGIFCALVLLFFLIIARFLDSTTSKKKRRKLINALFIICLIFMIIGTVGVVGFLGYVVLEAPAFDVNRLVNKESSILYDSEGNEVIKLGAELRENVQYSDLPEVLVDALIATEDSRFFQHNGFDAPRFIKASLGQIAGQNAGGASTLSMQVVKNSLTSTEASGFEGIVRKFTDIYLSVFKLEKNFTKEEIIEFYINNHCLGNHACGVEQASETYFGKTAKELNLAEAAMIVGMFQAPGSYNPYTNPQKTENRRNQVLNLMVKHGYISNDEATIAKSIPVSSMLQDKNAKTLEFQGYIDTVLTELNEQHGINPLKTPVLIYTNMDRSKQKALDDIFNGKTFKWIDDTVESGVAVVDVDTGKIVAIGAGRNKTTELSFNFATQGTRQIGSSAKPIFDYAPGMEYLGWGTYTQFLDEPHTYSNGVEVNNSDREFHGWMSIRTALAQSRNIPALKAFQQVSKEVGNEKIAQFAQSLGLYPDVQNGQIYEAHSLGAFTTKKGTTPLQMASAYAAFANGGYYIAPLTVNKVVFRDNGDVTTFESEKKQVMSDSTAFMITDSLVTAVQSGLSDGAKIPGVNVAAKTGTSSFDDATKKAKGLPGDAVNDAWIVGYDPEYAVSMWYGYDVSTKKHYHTSIQAVVQRKRLYQALGKAIFKKNNQPFKVPNSVVQVAIEQGTNPPLLASDSTPADQITYEYFKKGTEPTEASTAYQRLEKVQNLKVQYNEEKEELTISWSRLNAPEANEAYGEFGYNIYFGDTFLGFTTENSYTIHANTNINGTYKVVTTFKEYPNNQSEPAIFPFTYSPTVPTPSPTPTGDPQNLTVKINGDNPTIALNSTYTDISNPITTSNEVINNGLSAMTTATVTDPNGAIVGEFKNGKTVTFNATIVGTYKITYKVPYANKNYTAVRTITVQ